MSPKTGTPVSAAAPSLQVPEVVSIPRLNVTADVTAQATVQRTGPEKGLLTAPGNYHDLGWYRHGAVGVLVVDGHVGFGTGPGPLAYLGSLVPGDVVVVTFRDGRRTYRITKVARVLKGRLPSRFFYSGYNGQLMLITCDYTSPFHAGHFADNVYAIGAPVPASSAKH